VTTGFIVPIRTAVWRTVHNGVCVFAVAAAGTTQAPSNAVLPLRSVTMKGKTDRSLPHFEFPVV
jgi:hypothetical protein